MRTAVCGTINRAADGAEFGCRLADGQEAHARQNGRKKKGKPKHGWRRLEAAGEALERDATKTRLSVGREARARRRRIGERPIS